MADDIAQWLEGPGLGRCSRALAGNRADLEFGPGVADAEVRELRLTLGRHLVEEM